VTGSIRDYRTQQANEYRGPESPLSRVAASSVAEPHSKEPVMPESITDIGLDAHKERIHAAILLPGQANPIVDSFANTSEAIRRFVRRVQKQAPGPITSCYEAGVLGFGLQRTLIGFGLDCVVIAPSLIPSKPGDRIKTDRRDARKLAELHRAHLLTKVHAPTPDQEAVRDLCRAREAVKEDQKRLCHRLTKFLCVVPSAGRREEKLGRRHISSGSAFSAWGTLRTR
jgi:transposase